MPLTVGMMLIGAVTFFSFVGLGIGLGVIQKDDWQSVLGKLRIMKPEPE